MKTAEEVLRKFYEELVSQSPSEWKTFDEGIKDGSTETIYKAMNEYAKQFSEDCERILCAAIWYKDLPNQRIMLTNQDKGVIIAGFRHGHCMDIIADDGVGETVQGFITNRNRFVDRKEAAKIAFEAKQVRELHDILYSECLY